MLSSSMMNSAQKQAYTMVAVTPKIGPSTIKKLRQALGKYHISWSDFIQRPQWWPKSGLHSQQIAGLHQLLHQYTPAAYLQMLEERHIRTLVPDDADYPYLLQQIPDLPNCLFVLGNHKLLTTPITTVGVVGTRKMTEYGRFVTTKICQELTQLETCVVSGCMYGVDLTAHQATLAAGGKTIGVLGYGFDTLKTISYFPAQVLHTFLEQGVLVTEYPPDLPAAKGMFVRRNRIIAGLSHAVVVTEAGKTSGSLYTAHFAVDYNRLVCAVPGSIRSDMSEGTRVLLNEGATLVSSGYDVLKELGDSIALAKPISQKECGTAELLGGSPAQKEVYQLITQDQWTTEQLQQKLGWPTAQLHMILTQLEIRGNLSKAGGYWVPR